MCMLICNLLPMCLYRNQTKWENAAQQKSNYCKSIFNAIFEWFLWANCKFTKIFALSRTNYLKEKEPPIKDR